MTKLVLFGKCQIEIFIKLIVQNAISTFQIIGRLKPIITLAEVIYVKIFCPGELESLIDHDPLQHANKNQKNITEYEKLNI